MTDERKGLKGKYRYEEDGDGRPTLTHTDGHPIDRSARYFILRLDKDANPEMRAASRVATRAFALMIQGANPEFAADIFAELAGSLGEGEEEPWETMDFWVPDLTEVQAVSSQALNKRPTLLEGAANGVSGPLLVTRYGRPYIVAMSAEVYVFLRAMYGYLPLSGPEKVNVALAAPVLTDDELARLIEGIQEQPSHRQAVSVGWDYMGAFATLEMPRDGTAPEAVAILNHGGTWDILGDDSTLPSCEGCPPGALFLKLQGQWLRGWQKPTGTHEMSIGLDLAVPGSDRSAEVVYLRQPDGSMRVAAHSFLPFPEEDDYAAGSGKLPDEWIDEVVPSYDHTDFAEPGEV